MKAVHFGAGNIGRGFIGKLLSDSGIQVTFTDINQQIIDELASKHQYSVHIVGNSEITEKVTNVDGVLINDPRLIELIAETDLITTAVGPTILEKIATTIAQGLALRQQRNNQQPLNIIACENMLRGSSKLKQFVLQNLPEQQHNWLNQYIGFVDSAVDRIVPPANNTLNDILQVTVETFSEWIVDKNQFIGKIPSIEGMQLTDNLIAFVERKLFTLNTGHAITAYLGQHAGRETIRDAILLPEIYTVVKQAMHESGAVLIKRYAFDAEKHGQYIDKIIERFKNPYLHDDVLRVGRQPIRKLSPEERLIKPLQGTLEYNLPHHNLVIGIVAALAYRNSDDPQAVELAEMIQQQGITATISKLSGIAQQHPIITEINQAYLDFQ